MTAKSTTSPGPVDKKKNYKGRSFKTVWPGRDEENDTGDSETRGVTRRMTKGMRPGTGKKNPGCKTPAPFAERNQARQSFKTVAPRGASDSGGNLARVNSWVAGRRGSYT
jgi:hypothetical protein